MNSKPILFSGEMVKAILEGRKTQTRRVMKPQPECIGALESTPGGELVYLYPHGDGEKTYFCKFPYAHQLWVRETWKDNENAVYAEQVYSRGRRHAAPRFIYKADQIAETHGDWKPSIFMPRQASRITLEVVNVRVERVQEITKEDAKAEGASNVWRWDAKRNAEHPEYFSRSVLNPYVANYSVLWDEINAKRGFGWDVNPWVWVVEFKVLEVRDAVSKNRKKTT